MSRLNWKTQGRATASTKVRAKAKDSAKHYAMMRHVAGMKTKNPKLIVLDYAAVAERLKRRDTS